MELPIYSISPASKVVGFALRQQLPSPSSNHLSFNENGRELLINGDEEEEEGNEEADDQKKIPGYQDDFLFLTTVHSRKASKAEVDNHPLNLEPYFFPRPIFVNDAKDLTKEQLLIQLFDAILVGDRQSSVLSLLIQNYNYCFLAE